MKKILLIGIGNSGRGDDGLGWAFADKMVHDENFEVVYRYQLQIEDAELISGYEETWLIDASHQKLEHGFECTEVLPVANYTYTTHALHPSAVINLCHEVFQKQPMVFLLGISGSEFYLGAGLSPVAKNNLKRAMKFFLERKLKNID